MNAPAFHTLLPRAERSGIYHLPHAADLALEEAAEGLGYALFRLDLTHTTDKKGFLTAIGEALDFPDWYGHNWDALADCLNDMSWMEADGYVLVLDHADAFAAANPADFGTALTILQEASDAWREDGVPFWTLVGITADGIAWLRDLE
ncbi:MAG: hypothetical protein EKK49_02460 [Rhodocyclaceae bacterium]|nr:MAG: hypothetical protein EKK49_02460 [Rhodocyclaceae bacterium]